MKIEIEFLPEARLEFDDAVRYYAERDRAVSLAFIAEVDYAIERILQNPRQFPETRWLSKVQADAIPVPRDLLSRR